MSEKDVRENPTRRRFIQAVGLTTGAAALAGCTGSTSQADSTTDGSDETEASNGSGKQNSGSKTLRVGLSGNEVSTLDPALIDNEEDIMVASNIYNGLITYNKKLEVKPDLATDWEWSSETEVTFTLREGVTFHNGEELTAEDVKFSFERVLDEETGSPWRENLAIISEIAAEDDRTVTFTLDKSYAPLESYMVRRNMGGCIVPKQAVEEDGVDLANEPIGSGPFQVENWQQGSQLDLVPHDDFWKDGKPEMDSVTIQPIPDTTTLVTALEGGDVDLINTVPQQSISRLEDNSDVTVYSDKGANVRYMGFNTRDGNPFSDERVRQAASLALSRDNIINVLGPDVYEPNYSPVSKSISWAYTEDVEMQRQDTEQAQQLLEAAGATGTEITIKVWKDQSWRQTADVARDMLNEVGFNASVQVFEWGTFWDHVTANNDFDAFVLGWTGLTDPDQFMYSQFHSEGSWNWMGYSNEKLDSLLEEGRTTADQSKRADIYEEAQRIVANDAVYACLANQRLFQASRANVSGYELLPTSSLRLEDVQLD